MSLGHSAGGRDLCGLPFWNSGFHLEILSTARGVPAVRAALATGFGLFILASS